MEKKKLLRSKKSMLAGVCAGLANYFGVDPTIVRILFFAFCFFTAFIGGILFYIALWVIIPEESDNELEA